MKIMSSKWLPVLFVVFLTSCAQQSVDRKHSKEQEHKRAQQSAKLHTELAAEYFHRGQYKVAIEEVDEAFKAVSNYAPAYNMLGLIHMALLENNKAKNNFEQALSLAPKDSEIHNNYGWFLCQRVPDKMDQAISHFNAAVSDPLYQTPEKSYTNAGICELKRDRFVAAKDLLRKALSMAPDYSPAQMGLIEVDFKSGNLQEARTKIARYMKHSTQTPGSLWLAIQIERRLGDRYAEESYIHQLMKRFPDSKEASAAREGRSEL